ncbi:hypothetical protein ACJ73_08161 [Blastomyces percursus]|uniref:SNF2 N-terminal domain-containing protein n=1 Tax=Blastomyces percursus TaxID=1658174 RepID=A0A1J9QWE8_9EURO|nr:hypothetical protein ACJ73_08161 [Blastomyces percursus]
MFLALKYLIKEHSPSRLLDRSKRQKAGTTIYPDLQLVTVQGPTPTPTPTPAAISTLTKPSFPTTRPTRGRKRAASNTSNTRSISTSRSVRGARSSSRTPQEIADPESPRLLEPPPSSRNDEALTPRKRIPLTKTSESMNLDEPYWQWMMLRKAVKASEERDSESTENTDHFDIFRNEQYLHADSVNWAAELAKEREDEIIAPMQESIAKFLQNQTFLDNPVYQPQDNERACRELQIPNPKILRVKGMRRHLSLKFWQPVAVQAIRDFRASKHVKGCIESDVMGLGKTWVTIAYLLSLDFEVEKYGSKPVVVVVPPGLVGQWRQEIDSVTSQLKVWVYYGDSRDDKKGVLQVKWKLTVDHEIFLPNANAHRNVVVTSYQSLMPRNGPGAIDSWFRSHPSNETLRAEGISEGGNPFSLQDGHPAARLRLTCDAINKYIWDSSVNASLAGVRIGKVWQGCMIRRTLMSRLPAEVGPTIGSDIPAAEHRVVMCPFGKAQLANYHMITSHLYRGLVMKREGQIIINMGKYRQLTLFTSWTGFHIVHRTVLARNTPSIINAAAHMKLFPKWLNKIAKTRRITAVGASTKEAQAAAAAVAEQDKAATAARLELDSIPSNSEEYSAAVAEEERQSHLQAEKHAKLAAANAKLQHATVHSDSTLPFPVDEDVTTAANRENALTLVMLESRRLRELIKRLSNEVFELKEKSFVWTDGSGEQALVAGACHLAGISCVVFHAHLKAAERSKVVEEFNTNPDTPMVFIGTRYPVQGSTSNFSVGMSIASTLPKTGHLPCRRLAEYCGLARQKSSRYMSMSCPILSTCTSWRSPTPR